MYCSNCGAENDEGAVFCAKCGKSPNGAVSNDEGLKRARYPLINLSSRLFYPIFEIWLWVNLIVCTAAGGIASYYLTGGSGGRYGDPGTPLPGILIGLIAGFLVVIISGGLISTFLKINENIEKMGKKYQCD